MVYVARRSSFELSLAYTLKYGILALLSATRILPDKRVIYSNIYCFLLIIWTVFLPLFSLHNCFIQ